MMELALTDGEFCEGPLEVSQSQRLPGARDTGRPRAGAVSGACTERDELELSTRTAMISYSPVLSASQRRVGQSELTVDVKVEMWGPRIRCRRAAACQRDVFGTCGNRLCPTAWVDVISTKCGGANSWKSCATGDVNVNVVQSGGDRYGYQVR